MPTNEESMLELRKVPASQIESAIGLLGLRGRNEGVAGPGLQSLCRPTDGTTTIGYALTVEMGVSTNTKPVDTFDWLTFAAHLAGPKVLCVAAAEPAHAEGVLFGQISARILSRFGVVGAVVDGYVRDVAAIRQVPLALMARGTMLRHGVPHVAAFGRPVDIAGVRVETGQVVAMDADGVVVFPVSYLSRIREGLALARQRSGPLLDYLATTKQPTAAGIVAAQNEGKRIKP
jgi:regulator of RNase E activity RraA